MANIGLKGWTDIAAIDDLSPWKMVLPFFLAGSISSKIEDYSMHTSADSSVTRKSEHLKTSVVLSYSFKAGLGSDLVNEILLIVDKCKSSNHATTLN